MSIKIAHMTSVHPQNDNRIFYKECVTLNKNGYDVYLIAAGADSRLVKGVNIVGFEKKGSNRLIRMVRTSFFEILRVCRRVDADVYHFHDPELILAGLYLKAAGKKVIYDIHENNPASILSKPYIKSLFLKKVLSVFFDVFEKMAVRYFDALVTARPDISKRFRHNSLITLRNYPILPDFSKINEAKIEKDKPAVIYVGGMTELRGISQLLDAFESLDEYELWLLGPIKDKKIKNRIIKGCKNVKYFGSVEAHEVFNYIKKADIGIVTFLEAPNHIYTLATKPFEYMACAKPMIMSNFQYWRETFKESALYVDPSNSQEIAECIRCLFNDRVLMEKMGRLNRKLAHETFNWEKESAKLLELYGKLKK